MDELVYMCVCLNASYAACATKLLILVSWLTLFYGLAAIQGQRSGFRWILKCKRTYAFKFTIIIIIIVIYK